VKTEELIVTLAQANVPWTPLPPVRVRVTRWLLLSLGLCALTVVTIGARRDILLSLQDPGFVALALATFTAGLLASAAGMMLGVPGAERTPLWRALSVLLAGVWVVVLLARLASGGNAWPRIAAFPNHWACVAEIVGLSAVSGSVFFLMLRSAAPLQRTWSAALATLAPAALAATATQIMCPIDDPAHHLVSHVAPVALLAVIGTLTGRHALVWSSDRRPRSG
jgi:hypothetical protein